MNNFFRNIIETAVKSGIAALLVAIVYLACAFVSWELDWGRWHWALRLVFVVFELAAILWPWTAAERQIKKTKEATDGE